jgi:preprotein translocase subunit Sss1
MAFRSSRKQQPADFLSVAFSFFVVIVIVGWIGYLIFAH